MSTCLPISHLSVDVIYHYDWLNRTFNSVWMGYAYKLLDDVMVFSRINK
jgi:hypothetical protein